MLSCPRIGLYSLGINANSLNMCTRNSEHINSSNYEQLKFICFGIQRSTLGEYFLVGTGNDNYPPTLLGKVLYVQKYELKQETRNKKKIKEWNFLYSSNSRMRNRSFPSIKNLYRFLSRINTLTIPLCIASLWWDSWKKKSLTSAWVFPASSRQCESKYLGIWTRMCRKC